MSKHRSRKALSPAQLAFEAFLARYGEPTRTYVRIHLSQWFQWCADAGVDPLGVQRQHIELWARSLTEDCDYAVSTAAVKLNTVCGFYKVAHLDGLLPADPALHVRRIKVERVSTTEGLSRTEFADLLRVAEADGPTSHALVCLLGLNGLRVSEAVGVDVEHLGEHRGYRTVHLPHRKGGKTGTLAMSIRTAFAIEAARAGRSLGPVLVGAGGQRMSPRSAQRRIARLAKTAGIRKHISPHSLRHTFVTLALDAGVAERDIADSTGHSSTEMVRYYDRGRGAIERNATHAVTAFVGAA